MQKIVTTLRLQLTLQEQGYIVRKRTDNLEAYDTFLRGADYVYPRTKEGNVQARLLFEKTLERINPNWSLEVWRQRVPYKDPAVLEPHLAALRKAGLK